MTSVVVAPWAVTSAKVGVVEPGGQLTPFWRHTGEPFTWIAVANKLEPDAFANPSHEVEVPFVKLKFEAVPFVVVKFVAWLFVANRFVEVVFVPVAFVHVRLVKFDGAELETVKFVTAKEVNVALLATRFVVFNEAIVPEVAVRFVVAKFVVVALANNAFQRNADEPNDNVASIEGKKLPVDVPPAN